MWSSKSIDLYSQINIVKKKYMYSQFDSKNRPLDVGDLWKKQKSKYTMKVMNNAGLKHHLYDSGIGLFI